MEELENVRAEAVQMMGVFQVLPKLVVFDLDYTIWPFYCECRSKHDTPSLFPHSRGILAALKDQGIQTAIASKSPTPHIATTFLDKLNITSMFAAKEIFYTSTHKTEHFQKIYSRTGVSYNSMLFFDDDNNNIQEITKLGVTSILVRNGVNLGIFREGLTRFSQNLDASKNKQKRRK
ncbi:magnesium-dependent phosphatase [Trifolium repens]|nr:magnesium-dependent phosphatase [Trifolium repens]